MTAMTLVAALASFIFLPLSQALIDAYGWRDALLVLAVDPRRDDGPAARARAPPGAAPAPDRSRRAASVAGGRGAALAAVLAALRRVLPGTAERRSR